ncbi:peptidase family C78-domain-containing protein [Pisolithus orientalis]|uniref:peptidase family C78-domain-containing protein n=1 Tax=Pisolithus orientalis TaxID=936130 RepID=UPI00222431F6|nr:peptidase family C78-domain-containing protein [Pisolithus orientalis]KAI6019648.1 peptidase family C78-domain-containing protein [Pisolithus orientalis]
MSLEQRDQHYEDHRTSTKKPISINKRKSSRKHTASPLPSKPRSCIFPCLTKRTEEEFWYPTLSEPPPANYTPGLLSILKEALKKSNHKGFTDRAVLCYERTPHIAVAKTPANQTRFSYRNFLMACAALMDQKIQPSYLGYLNNPIPPGVRNLQQWIEDAWEQGYDEIGAKQLGDELVGTQKFIGTADMYSVLSFRGIPCTLVDFDLTSSKGQLSLYRLCPLTHWVVEYFSGPVKKQGTINDVLRGASPVITTEKMPIILQYKGHSVTIVGYEVQSKSKEMPINQSSSSSIPEDARRAALAGPRSVTWGTPSSKFSRILQAGQRKFQIGPSRKRARFDPDVQSTIVISDSDDEEKARKEDGNLTLHAGNTIGAFRWTKPNLQKRKQFQLLYFPMEEPLSQQERRKRKVVYTM